MKPKLKRLAILLIFLSLLPRTGLGSDGVIRVGVSDAAPFAIEEGDGSWGGIAIELWRSVANQLGLTYELIPYSNVHDLETAIERRQIDIAVSDFTIVHSHEEIFDYSRAFFHSEISIAGRTDDKTFFGKLLDSMLSETVLNIVAVMFALVVLGAGIFWILEKQENKVLYDKRHGKANFYNGIMWALLLITAQEPDIFKNQSLLGRVVAMFLLIIGVTASASYIALITSTLTAHKIDTVVIGKNDLAHIRVAARHWSRASEYLTSQHLKHAVLDDFEEMMEALEAREFDAVVADEVKIRYYIRRHMDQHISQSPIHLNTEYFAFVFPKGSELVQKVNPAISKFVENAIWQDLIRRYLGEMDIPR